MELSKLGEKVHRSKSASTMKSKSEKITRLDSIANGLGIKQNGSSHDAVEDVEVLRACILEATKRKGISVQDFFAASKKPLKGMM